MPLFDEKLISPFAIRFSQTRVRPTFQDGRELTTAIDQIEAIDFDPNEHGDGDYDVLLRAPFPPIEIIRWEPRLLEADGTHGSERGEARWITFDNRRLCCLQRAAAAQWPRSAAAVVNVLYGLPVEQSAVRKMEHASAKTAVNVGRLDEPNPKVWDWMTATRSHGDDTKMIVETLTTIQADAGSDRTGLLDAPPAAIPEHSAALEGSAFERFINAAKKAEDATRTPLSTAQRKADVPEPVYIGKSCAALSAQNSPHAITADQLLAHWMLLSESPPVLPAAELPLVEPSVAPSWPTMPLSASPWLTPLSSAWAAPDLTPSPVLSALPAAPSWPEGLAPPPGLGPDELWAAPSFLSGSSLDGYMAEPFLPPPSLLTGAPTSVFSHDFDDRSCSLPGSPISTFNQDTSPPFTPANSLPFFLPSGHSSPLSSPWRSGASSVTTAASPVAQSFGNKVPAVEQLFAMAAAKRELHTSQKPTKQSAGEELLSMLKGPEAAAQAAWPPQHCGQTMHTNQAGRELLDLLRA